MLALLSDQGWEGAGPVASMKKRVPQFLQNQVHPSTSTASSPWLTVAEAAEYLRTSRGAIYKRIRRGQLASHRPEGSPILIWRDDLVGTGPFTRSGPSRPPSTNGPARLQPPGTRRSQEVSPDAEASSQAAAASLPPRTARPELNRRPRSDTDRREGDTFEVVYRDDAGRQRQKTRNARSLQRAIIEAEEHRSDVRRGEAVPTSRLTFNEVAHEFFALTESLVATGERSQRTLDLYRQRCSKHVEPLIGRRRVSEVRAQQIGLIYARQRRDGLAPWTISGTHTIISAVLTFALARGYIATNPLTRLARIERPTESTEREARRLSDDEVRKLCDSASPRYRPIVTALAWTGLRVSEALALRWEDIDFEGREILRAVPARRKKGL